MPNQMTSFVSVPVELHFDVLQFLSRNEVEKCQLVTQKWDQIIQENGTYLPLRMCEFLHIFNVNDGSRTQVKTYVVIDHENGFSILYENMLNMVEMIKSLKYCIFKEVKVKIRTLLAGCHLPANMPACPKPFLSHASTWFP
jgi:hypothetical protein